MRSGWSVATVAPAHVAFVVLIALHVVSAVVGFAGLALSGAYAATARQLDRPGAREEATRWFARPNRAGLAVLAVPWFALAGLAVGGRRGELGEWWVAVALAIWLAVAVIAVAVIRPAEGRLRRLLQPVAPVAAGSSPAPALDPEARAAVRAAADRLYRAAAVCDVAFVVALALMIWQPH